jgi:uncharacterized membrane protein YfcA
MIKLAIAIGLISGMIGGLFGLSGSFLIIAALSYFKMVPDQQTAAGTTLFIILPPVTLLSVIYFWKNKKIDFKLAWWIMGFYVIGSGIGTLGTSTFSDKQIKLYVSILFFILGSISLVTYLRISEKTHPVNVINK